MHNESLRNEPLRVLLVEDSEDDAELTVLALRGGGLHVVAQRMDTESDYLAALQTTPDLILTDYYMPQFTAERALELLQARDLDVPFIVVSGLVSAEAAIALMRAGAHDYLLKDDLTRLCPAVRRELREARGRAQRRMAEQRLRAMFENAQAGMYELDLSGRILQVNPAYCELTGYRRDELLAANIADFTHPEDQAADREHAALIRAGTATVKSREKRYIRKDGAIAWVNLTASTIQLPGEQPHIFGVTVDIAARKEAEQALRERERHFRQLAEGLPQLVWTSRRDGSCDYLSPQWVKYTGVPEAAQLESGWLQQVHPDDRQNAAQAWRRAMAADDANLDLECRMRGADGIYRWFKMRAVPLRDANGTIVKWFGTNTDIHDQKCAEESARESEARLNAAMTYAGIGSWEVNLVTGRTVVSEQIGPIFGKPAGWSNFDPTLWKTLLHPDDREQTIARLQRALANDTGYQAEYRALWDDAVTVRWLEVSATIIRDELGRPRRLVGLARDITERKATEAKIQYLAHHDGLTGLPNRALLMDFMTQALAQAERNGQGLAVLFIDLDHFKTINDSLGHEIGDKLLKQVAARLRRCERRSDILARLGGDEFVMVLSGIKDVLGATLVAEKIVASLSRPYRADNHVLNTSCSIGISLYPHDARDAQALMKNADMAMYHAKERGRNVYQFFSPEMGARADERLKLGNALRQALERNEFVLHYQPCFALASGRIIGVEALIRWKHPELGLLSPARFIPLAEETGMITPIGHWVLRTACAQVMTWRERSLECPKVAVNLSARQFRQLGLRQQIAAILKETGLEATALELEITESMAMQDPARTRRLLHELKDMGLGLSIDDFGTGYSSLSYLKGFPIRCLKIDRSFIDGIPNDPHDAAITRATIALAKILGLDVIAEGVETEAQKSFLASAGCENAQGYLFGRPAEAAEIEALLRPADDSKFRAASVTGGN